MSQHDPHPLPTCFKRIRLELARQPGHPNGDSNIGYLLTAPLDADGKLLGAEAHVHAHACQVTRFDGPNTSHGLLRHGPGGMWAFHYEFGDGKTDDDPGYRLGQHRFVEGEYVTIHEDEGERVYRIASVRSIQA